MAYTPPGETRKKVYEFVRERILNGSPPTVREVQRAFGFRAVQSARQHLEALVAEGKLVKDSGKSRSHRLPELGRVRSSHPDPHAGPRPGGGADHGPAGPGRLSPGAEDPLRRPGALRPDGSGGEHARCRHPAGGHRDRPPAAGRPGPGEIVVALVGEEATVKRYREKRGRVELHPENDAFEPIVPREDGEPFSILGKVIEVRRNLE